MEFGKEIGTAIPLLITLLNDDNYLVRPATVSALTKLADHGELVPICHLDVANVQ